MPEALLLLLLFFFCTRNGGSQVRTPVFGPMLRQSGWRPLARRSCTISSRDSGARRSGRHSHIITYECVFLPFITDFCLASWSIWWFTKRRHKRKRKQKLEAAFNKKSVVTSSLCGCKLWCVYRVRVKAALCLVCWFNTETCRLVWGVSLYTTPC